MIIWVVGSLSWFRDRVRGRGVGPCKSLSSDQILVVGSAALGATFIRVRLFSFSLIDGFRGASLGSRGLL